MDACVLCFGGDSVSLSVACSYINGTHKVKARAELPFSGIVNGEFVNTAEIHGLLRELLKRVGMVKTSLTVGVPPCFCKVSVTTEKAVFTRPKRITQKETAALQKDGRAVYYKIDGGAPVIDACGHVAQGTVEACISHVAINPNFAAIFREYDVKFIPTVQAEANFLIDGYARDKTCVLISCGMFDTSVAVAAGDELCALETFYMGSAHIINDISLVMNSDWAAAKAKFEAYRADGGYLAEIINARINDMAEQIFGLVNALDRDLWSRPVYICGGQADAVPKAINVLEAALDVKIIQCVCPYTESNTPSVTRDALINAALK